MSVNVENQLRKCVLLCISSLLMTITFSLQERPYIDPDTPESKRSITRLFDKKRMTLVFSDEFNTPDRSFAPGDDAFFEALNRPDDTNHAIQFYNSSKEYVTTKDGYLQIYTRAEKTTYQLYNLATEMYDTYVMNYTSAMVQSWNKFCYTGGVIEFAVQLPGDGNTSGLWPAVWLMGNLGRAVYQNSSQYIWPWSTNQCLKTFQETGQLLSACDAEPGDGLHPNQGRGAPEIDIFESMANQWKMAGQPKYIQSYVSSSLQISPGSPWNDPHRPLCGQTIVPDGNRTMGYMYGWGCNNYTCKGCAGAGGPNHDECNDVCIEYDYNWGCNISWYSHLKLGKYSGPDDVGPFPTGMFNGYYGQLVPQTIYRGQNWGPSYVADGISWNTNIEPSMYQRPHKYRLEWQPGDYIDWYLDDVFIFGIPQESLTRKGNGAVIPGEPMYIIANVAMSNSWGIQNSCDFYGECALICDSGCVDCNNPECQCALPDGMKGCAMFPTALKIDYVRLYQDPDDDLHTLGCSPPKYPTKEYIENNPYGYANWKAADCSPHCVNPKCVTVANGLCLQIPWDLLWTLAILLLALAGWIFFHILISQEKGGYVQIDMPQYEESTERTRLYQYRDSRDSSRDSSRESKYRDSRDNSRESKYRDRRNDGNGEHESS